MTGSPTSEGPIHIERRGAIEILSLDRPDALNTLDEPLTFALRDYFAGLGERLDVRVVVLRAEGRAFCAGLDLAGWENDGSRGELQHYWRLQRAIAGLLELMRACPQPIIGLGHGAACGLDDAWIGAFRQDDMMACGPSHVAQGEERRGHVAAPLIVL